MPEQLNDQFKIGQRVKLTRVRHQKYRGLEGEVTRIFISKKVVVVQVSPNNFYHADPANIDPVPAEVAA